MMDLDKDNILMWVRGLIIERQELADKLEVRERKIDELNEEIHDLNFELKGFL